MGSGGFDGMLEVPEVIRSRYSAGNWKCYIMMVAKQGYLLQHMMVKQTTSGTWDFENKIIDGKRAYHELGKAMRHIRADGNLCHAAFGPFTLGYSTCQKDTRTYTSTSS